MVVNNYAKWPKHALQPCKSPCGRCSEAPVGVGFRGRVSSFVITSRFTSIMVSIMVTVVLSTYAQPAQKPATAIAKPSVADTTVKISEVQPVVAIKPVVVADSLHPIELLPISDTVKVPTLDFKNTSVVDILRALGVQYKVNIYIDPEVKGNTSFYLVNVPLKFAIDFIAKRNNLAYVVENNIIKIFKYQPPPVVVAEPTQLFHFANGLLDIDIRNVSVQKLAAYFLDSVGINVMIDGQADKSVNARLRGLKPERVLKIICETNGLKLSSSDGIYYIALQNWGPDQAKPSGGSSMQRLTISVDQNQNITLEVDNAALDQVVRTIATQGGINIVIYDNIIGNISAKFSNTYIDNAFKFLLENTRFTYWKDKDIYFIGSREMSQQKTVQVIVLKYIMADEDILSKQLPPHLLKDAVIKYDKEHNAIIVIGSYDVVAQTQDFIDKIDKPVPQVLIEALVVDFQVNKFREYGVKFFTGGLDSLLPKSQEYFPAITNVRGSTQTIQHALNEVMKFLNVNQIVELPADFLALVNALEGADIAKIHSTPQIATLNGNPASITIGETRYFKLKRQTDIPTNNNNVSITTNEQFEKIQFNNKLEITPWVMADRYVTVKIKPEFNIPRKKEDSDVPPSVDTRVLESTVRLKDGQTIVLGGQRQTNTVETSRSLPFLGSIPILGWLFSNKKTETVVTQMMIFLTPHIYYKEEGAVNPEKFFDMGEDPMQLERDKINNREWGNPFAPAPIKN